MDQNKDDPSMSLKEIHFSKSKRKKLIELDFHTFMGNNFSMSLDKFWKWRSYNWI